MPEPRMKNARQMATFLPLACAALPAAADYHLNLTEGVTAISRRAYELHMMALWICVAIGVVVFGAIAWAVVHHRKSRGATPRRTW